jgi:hypothetical protein
MSRSSSLSTKDRASQNKRPKAPKQRRDDSESFDVRSQYTPFFPQPQGPTWASTQQFAPTGPQPFNGVVQTNYPNPMQPQFIPQPAPQFNPGMPINNMNNGNMPMYNPMSQVIHLHAILMDLQIDKSTAVSSAKPATLPTSQCADQRLWVTCPVASTGTPAMASIESLPEPISDPRTHAKSSPEFDTLCIWSVA